MREMFIGLVICIVFVIPMLAVTGGVLYFKASQEAKTFNKFSEQDATTWDAVFADLRIEACRNN